MRKENKKLSPLLVFLTIISERLGKFYYEINI